MPSYVTGDLAFPSDTARVNDARVHIHNYTTLLLSSFPAAQTNNSCPPGLRRTRGLCPAGDFERTSVAVPHAGPSSNNQPRLVMCTLITFAEHCDTALATGYVNATPSDHVSHNCTESCSLRRECPLTRPQPPEIIGSRLIKCVKYNSAGK